MTPPDVPEKPPVVEPSIDGGGAQITGAENSTNSGTSSDENADQEPSSAETTESETSSAETTESETSSAETTESETSPPETTESDDIEYIDYTLLPPEQQDQTEVISTTIIVIKEIIRKTYCIYLDLL